MLEIRDAQLTKVAQNHTGVIPTPYLFNLASKDVTVANAPGYVMTIANGRVGLSGGPMLDEDGSVVGMCFVGLPPDAPVRDDIGALDIRLLPFL